MMAQRREKQSKPPQKIYKLTFNELQMVNQQIFAESYIVVRNLRSGTSWQSDNFYNRMFQPWSIEVDGTDLAMELYMNTKKKTAKVAYGNLHQGADTMYLEQLLNPGQKFFLARYQLWQKFEEEEPKRKQNRFLNNSKMFNTLVDDNKNDISAVIERDQGNLNERNPTDHTEDEKVAFHGDISVISSVGDQSVRIQPIKQPIPQESEADESSYQRIGYVDPSNDSTSFIKAMLSGLAQEERLNNTAQVIEPKMQQPKDLAGIKQNPDESQDEYRTTAEKWYAQKFNKKNLKFKKKNSMAFKQKQAQQKQKGARAIDVIAYNTQFLQQESTIRQMTDMSVEEYLRLKSIDFSLSAEEQSSKLYRLARNDGNSSSLWYTAISLPNEGLITVQCSTLNGQLNGCLGSEEMRKGQCPLFDGSGNSIGNFTFKCKSVCNFIVQTQELFPSGVQNIYIEPRQDQKQKDLQVIKKQLKNESQSVLQEEKIQEIKVMPAQSVEQLKKEPQNLQKEQQKELIIQKHQQQAQQASKFQTQNPLKQETIVKKQQTDPKDIQIRPKQPQQEMKSTQKEKEQKMNEAKKSVRQSRHQRYATLPIQLDSDSRKQSSPPSPLQKINDTMKFDTIESKEAGSQNFATVPVMGHSFSTGGVEHQQSQIWQNPGSSMSNRRRETAHGSHRQNHREQQAQGEQILIQSKVHSVLSNKHRLDFKIEGIKLYFSKPSYQGKIIKMELQKNVYYTETSRDIYFPSWQGKGYFFQGVSEYSILRLQLIQQYDGMQNIIGRCNIHLPFLKTKVVNEVLQYEDSMREDDESQLSKVKIQYKIIDKNKMNSRHKARKIESSYTLNYLNDEINIQNSGSIAASQRLPRKKTKVHTQRGSTEGSQRTNDSFQIRDYLKRPIYLNYESRGGETTLFSRKNHSPMAKRKYTGGNIRIPKASRFVEQKMNNNLKKGDPGPGAYEMPSMFDRHATPF